MTDVPAEPDPPSDPRAVRRDQAAPPGLPQPRIVRARRWNISLVWLVPAVAIAIAVSMLVRTLFLIGPRIDIEFTSADGVEAGKTEVRFKEVVIGRVRTVSLRPDRKRVVVGVQLDRSAADFAVDDTTFWVVRPRIGAAGVSGLNTLISGAYIGVDAGVSEKARTEFVGLDAPPFVMRGEPGSIFVLRADDLGSLDVGSPVYHRRTPVGRVVGYTLDAASDELSLKVFIDAPFQRLVTRETRFWNASGIDLTLNASGLSVNTQTLASVLAGGLAFEVPPDTPLGPPAPENTVFTLFSDRPAALAPPDGAPVPVRMVFEQSVRGLAPGAAVDLLGVDIGRVRSVELHYDARRKRFPIEVTADVFPLRLGAVRTVLVRESGGSDDAAVIKQLVASGLRAQLRTGNLLTGQLYVALDFIPGPARSSGAIAEDGFVRLPTAPGTLSEIQPQIADIVSKVSKIPFEEIGKDLRTTLSRASQAIGRLTPEAQRALADVSKTLGKAQATLDGLERTLQGVDRTLEGVDRNITDPSAPVQRNVEGTLLELQRTARALRILADYLQQHPEALLRGKPADRPVPPR